MYKVNFYLKLLILFLTFVIVALTSNYIILWFLLAILTFIHFYSKNKKLIFLDLLLVVFLGVSYKLCSLLFLYKIIYLIDIVITFIISLLFKEKRFFKLLFNMYDNKSNKTRFYEENYNDILLNNENKAFVKYGSDISINDKSKEDLDRKYLQAKIRFYGYNERNTPLFFKWTKTDSILLALVLIIFIILFILR